MICFSSYYSLFIFSSVWNYFRKLTVTSKLMKKYLRNSDKLLKNHLYNGILKGKTRIQVLNDFHIHLKAVN